MIKQGDWLEQPFILHVQAEIYNMEKLVQENRKFDYYLPVNKETMKQSAILLLQLTTRNIFTEIFSEFNLKDYQWQWVVSDSGEIIYDNNKNKIEYSQLDKITKESYRRIS